MKAKSESKHSESGVHKCDESQNREQAVEKWRSSTRWKPEHNQYNEVAMIILKADSTEKIIDKIELTRKN
ncbi:hypothetical protein M3649_09060 [Ureibacillus chungkukjangi]|uniref:hypothetical protein n=1 Tax=Ureibacillus chungkukjangi TaxID=1202712 RepID=UPI00203BA9C2|nr:hypothetical protein [Ureibacillus chungkukjangi]MCM3388281.1 hypothetical protein [Ureibacillus chungkukjangi]